MQALLEPRHNTMTCEHLKGVLAYTKRAQLKAKYVVKEQSYTLYNVYVRYKMNVCGQEWDVYKCRTTGDQHHTNIF
jgi:hypothetical protein